jgi:processive 1,2-diacylglycerol beta-glucosyltransferase
VGSDRIRVTGMPVKRTFLARSGLTRRELRAKLGLRPEVFTVLTMGGSLGLARFREVAHALDRSGLPLQGVFITGRNGRQKIELDDLTRRLAVPCTVLGSADNLHEWVEASDVVVTRAGGMTTAEIVATGRPMIRLDSEDYLEQMQATHLQASGRNFINCDAGHLPVALARLMSDGRETWQDVERTRRSFRLTASRDIAADILASLQSLPTSPPACS